MSWLSFLRRKRSDAELQDEIETFLAEETADNEARGMSPEEARRQARVKLGNAQKVRESLWAQNSALPLTNIGHDLKYALRTLAARPDSRSSRLRSWLSALVRPHLFSQLCARFC